jgi:hypothetical protein
MRSWKSFVAYPYFLQEWGKRRRAIAYQSCRCKAGEAINELDASFFRVRFAPSEKRYMRAMAEMARTGRRHKKVTTTAHHKGHDL